MPEKLLSPNYGISKSLLGKITATENDVIVGKSFIGSDGDLKIGAVPDRGQYQYSNRIYVVGDYIAFEDIPEGIYRKNGAVWAPEIRADLETVKNLVGSTVGKTGTNGGTDLNETTYVGCDKGAQWGSIKIRNMVLTINTGTTATVSFDATCSLEPSGQIFPYRRGTFTFNLV